MSKLKNVRFKDGVCYFDVHSKHGIFIVMIDEEDYDKCKDYYWCYGRTDRGERYFRIQTKINNKVVKIYRFILNLTDPSIMLDHINCNPLDNRKNNLRICSNVENSRNRGKTKSNKSGYKGVSWHKPSNKWRAQIDINQKNKHLGCFTIKEDAAKAYNEAAIKYHGKFAKLNIIKEK